MLNCLTSWRKVNFHCTYSIVVVDVQYFIEMRGFCDSSSGNALIWMISTEILARIPPSGGCRVRFESRDLSAVQ